MQDITYKAVAVNPGAAENNLSAQRQFAAWLVHFGIEIGTIKNPLERDEKDGTNQDLHVLRQEVRSQQSA